MDIFGPGKWGEGEALFCLPQSACWKAKTISIYALCFVCHLSGYSFVSFADSAFFA